MPTSPDKFNLSSDAFAYIGQVRAVETDTRKRQDAVDEIVRLLRPIAKLPMADTNIASIVTTALARIFGDDVRRENERLRAEQQAPPPWLTNLLEQNGAARDRPGHEGKSARAALVGNEYPKMPYCPLALNRMSS